MTRPQYLVLQEVADELRISYSSVLSLVRSGALSAIDVSTNPRGRSRYIVPRASLEQLLEARAVVPTAAPARQRSRRQSSRVAQHWSED